jgi:hypothetical protein
MACFVGVAELPVWHSHHFLYSQCSSWWSTMAFLLSAAVAVCMWSHHGALGFSAQRLLLFFAQQKNYIHSSSVCRLIFILLRSISRTLVVLMAGQTVKWGISQSMYEPMLPVYLLYSAIQQWLLITTTYGLELTQLGSMPLGPNSLLYTCALFSIAALECVIKVMSSSPRGR